MSRVLRALHPFDVLFAFTIGLAALPLAPTVITTLWVAAVIGAAVSARHGSITLRIGGTEEASRSDTEP